MIEVIHAGLEDYEVVYSLAQQVWPQTYSKILSEEQVNYMFAMMYSQKAFNEQLTIKGHQYLLAKKDGQYLGFASYELNYKPGIAKLHKIYVLPHLQVKGTGRTLLSAVEDIAEKNGNTSLTLNVNRYNNAIHFYTKLGYNVVGQEDIDIGNNYLMEDFIMQKEL
jgi:ribosomal protein S18 acetylase RimI-like enzyme